MTCTAIIGGTGLTDLVGLNVLSSHHASTQWGDVSAALLRGCFQGKDVIFLPRHGANYQLPPHRINYRANIQALKDAGVKRILAVNAVGGITSEMDNGALCVPDQLIDYTWGRESTFFNDGLEYPVFVDFTDPYSSTLRDAFCAGAQKAGVAVIEGGVYGCTQGPRLETAAEIRRMERDGCDIVGMTGMPEAVLARELGLEYASLALVVNKAAGKCRQEITMGDIKRQLVLGMHKAQAVLSGALKELA